MIDVVAAVIVKDNKFLITRRAPKLKLEGMWEFPGGKVEEGESLYTAEEALKRELVEELKIETEIGNYIETSIYEYPNVTVKLMAYFATVISGEIKLSVHDEAKWISISEVENFKFAPADIPFIEKLKEVL